MSGKIRSLADAGPLVLWHVTSALAGQNSNLSHFGSSRTVEIQTSTSIALVCYDLIVGIEKLSALEERRVMSGRYLAMSYSLSGYTDAARAYARSSNIALFKYTQDGAVYSTNDTASTMESESGRQELTAVALSSNGQPDRLADEAQQYLDEICAKGMAVAEAIREAAVMSGRTMHYHIQHSHQLIEALSMARAEMRHAQFLLSKFMEDPEGVPEQLILRLEPMEQAQRQAASALELDYDEEIARWGVRRRVIERIASAHDYRLRRPDDGTHGFN